MIAMSELLTFGSLLTAGGALGGVILGFWIAGNLSVAAKSASLSASSAKTPAAVSRKVV
jgi:hypothetical protein